jgi:hypothetical protein
MGGSAASALPVSSVSIPQYLPHIILSFDDLDVRDADNNVVQASAAQNALQDLFASGLYGAMVESELHSMARAFSILEIKLNHTAQSFARRLQVLIQCLSPAWLPSRRNLECVACMARGPALFAGLAAPAILAAAFSDSSRSIPLAFPVLRC